MIDLAKLTKPEWRRLLYGHREDAHYPRDTIKDDADRYIIKEFTKDDLDRYIIANSLLSQRDAKPIFENEKWDIARSPLYQPPIDTDVPVYREPQVVLCQHEPAAELPKFNRPFIAGRGPVLVLIQMPVWFEAESGGPPKRHIRNKWPSVSFQTKADWYPGKDAGCKPPDDIHSAFRPQIDAPQIVKFVSNRRRQVSRENAA